MPQLRTGNWDRARMTLQPSWSVPTTLTRTIPGGRTRDCRRRNGRRGCSRHSNIWLLPRKGPATTTPTDRIPGHHRGGSVPTRYKWLISNPSLTGASHRPSAATEASPAVNIHRLGQPKCPTGYGIAHRSRNAGWGAGEQRSCEGPVRPRHPCPAGFGNQGFPKPEASPVRGGNPIPRRTPLTCRGGMNIMRSIVPSSVFHPSGSRPKEFRPAS